MNNKEKLRVKCVSMARRSGQTARVNAARLDAMLKLYSKKDISKNQWLLKKIIKAGNSINRNLKNAAILGARINSLDSQR